MPDRDPSKHPPESGGTATDSTADPLPDWARPAEPAMPGARWLTAARRWWGMAPEGPPEPADVAPPGPPRAGVDAPAVLVDRLQRCIAHAARHPGFGFALLRVQIDAPPPAVARARGSDPGRQAERRLQLALRPGDVLTPLAQPGAFAAVLDGVAGKADLQAIVQRLRDDLAAPYTEGPEPRRAPARLAAVFLAPGDPAGSPAEIVQRAELALAEAGIDGWVLAASALRPGSRRLQQALSAGGLRLGFEPQVDLERAVVTALGARFFLRGSSGQPLGADEPGDDDGLAMALLQRQLDMAVVPFLQWRTTQPGRRACRLALPVSAALVRRAGWADELAALLHEAGVAGVDVQLELPPSLPLHDRNLPARLQALAQQGLALALDDFGTGQSSLSALGRLPLSLLKIDRGFVPQAHELEHHRVLLESTVRLARQLGIATLGKGLVAASQLEQLRALGCQRGEGAAASALLPQGAMGSLPRPQQVA